MVEQAFCCLRPHSSRRLFEMVGNEWRLTDGAAPAKARVATDEPTTLRTTSQSHFVSAWALPFFVQSTHRFAQVIVTKSSSRLLL